MTSVPILLRVPIPVIGDKQTYNEHVRDLFRPLLLSKTCVVVAFKLKVYVRMRVALRNLVSSIACDLTRGTASRMDADLGL
jgi:hypothetical protein